MYDKQEANSRISRSALSASDESYLFEDDGLPSPKNSEHLSTVTLKTQMIQKQLGELMWMIKCSKAIGDGKVAAFHNMLDQKVSDLEKVEVQFKVEELRMHSRTGGQLSEQEINQMTLSLEEEETKLEAKVKASFFDLVEQPIDLTGKYEEAQSAIQQFRSNFIRSANFLAAQIQSISSNALLQIREVESMMAEKQIQQRQTEKEWSQSILEMEKELSSVIEMEIDQSEKQLSRVYQILETGCVSFYTF